MKKRVEAFLKNPKTHSETFDDGDGGTERVSGRVAVECLDQATKDDIIMLLLDDMLCLAEIEAKRAFKEQIETIQTALGNTSDYTQRPPASGGNNEALTDC